MTAERIRTGIDELDEILGGGFLANSINLIMGLPGTGKTILAEQIIFHNATAERPALYLTTLSEPLEKFITHGQTYGFFDSAGVGITVIYEDLGLMLKERGLDALPEIVTELIGQYRPGFIVIDSFKALEELRPRSEERRLIIFDLANLLSVYKTTSFLIGEYAPEMMTDLAEFAIADSVLQLLKLQSGMRAQRFLKVEKLRGSMSVPGMHAFDISASGLQIYPRLLTPSVSPDYTADVERVNTGIKGLDEMVKQGFWRGSTTLLAGPTGSGKTAIGLHFIREGVSRGEPGVYVGFQENPVQLARTLKNFGWNAEKLLSEGGGFEHLYRSPVEMYLDSVVLELFRRVREKRVKRVVIDSLGDLRRRSFDRERLTEYLYALTQWFAVEGVTCMVLLELATLFEVNRLSDEEVSNMSDNIVLLRFNAGEEMTRTVRIIKTRNSNHDHFEHKLRITSQGVIIERTSDARPRPDNGH